MHQYATFWMRTLDWDGNHFLHLMRGFLTHEFNFEGPSAMSFSTSTANVGTLRICAIPLGPIRPIAVTRGLCSNHGDYGGCGVRCTLTDSKNSRVRLFDTPFSAMRPPLTSESLISFFFFSFRNAQTSFVHFHVPCYFLHSLILSNANLSCGLFQE